MSHLSRLLDYTVNCFIVRHDKVLLIYNKTYDMWLAPGGHIDPDENLEDTIYREIEEETGIKKGELTLLDPRNSIPSENIFSDYKGSSLVTPTFTDVHEAGKGHLHIAFRFFLTTTKDVTGSDDVSVISHEWLSETDLDLPKYSLKKAIKFYAKYALDLVKK